MSGMVVASNIMAMNIYGKLKAIGGKNASASEKLSSGFRINRAADDVAGFAISDKMKAQIRGMEQAQRNVEDGINLIRTMDGGMSGIQEIMNRQRELIIQGLNDTNTDEDRAKIQMELDQLTEEISAVADRVEFNKMKLLNGEDFNRVVRGGGAIYSTSTTTDTVPVYRTEYRYVLDVISTQISHDVYDSPAVDNNGYFNFFATNTMGQNTQLLFGDRTPSNSGYPSTSYPAIRVDTGSGVFKTYSLWPNSTGGVPRDNAMTISPLGTTYDAASERWETRYSMVDSNTGLDFEVVQYVSIAKYGSERTETVSLTAPDGTDLSGNYTYWDGGQSYCVEYEVINNGASDLNFDFMYHVDTAANGTDTSPFVMPGSTTALKKTTWESDQIPESLWMYDSISNPLVNVEITFKNTANYQFDSGSEPDKVSIGGWPYSANFDNMGNGTSIGDSDYAVIWSGRNAAAGSASGKMTTYFGVTSPPADVMARIGDITEYQVLDHFEERTTTQKSLKGSSEIQEKMEKGIWIQCGANSEQGVIVDLYDCRPESLGIQDLVIDPLEAAKQSLNGLDEAFGKINTYRAKAGAQQNRIEFTANSLALSHTNLADANARISDADMAKEMIEFTKANILQQSSVALLVQANQVPQKVLQLLQ